MPFLIAIVAVLALCSPVAAREEAKTVTVEGVDFVYTIQKTPAGEDFGYFVATSQWPGEADGTTIVFVCWENYSPAMEREHRLVQDAVTGSWQKHAKLEFRGWQPCADRSSGIRIFIEDDAAGGPHTKGLGRDLDGKDRGMVLNFTFNHWSEPCKETPEKRDYCVKAIAVHEFGHALGFAHEQNRPDRPGECREPAQGLSAGAAMLTPYDPHSVMNYCNAKYNNDGQLSVWDTVALQRVYGAR
jgi:hypothetical protein